jgi:glutamine amidotransferase PdxT
VLVQKANVLAATFHPELTSDPAVHRHFLNMVGAWQGRPASIAG